MSQTEYDRLNNAIVSLENFHRGKNDMNYITVSKVLHAARAHLATIPREKFVDVWFIECADNGCPMHIAMVGYEPTKAGVDLSYGKDYDTVRVTGPHKFLVGYEHENSTNPGNNCDDI